jgi:hypothetical protein
MKTALYVAGIAVGTLIAVKLVKMTTFGASMLAKIGF